MEISIHSLLEDDRLRCRHRRFLSIHDRRCRLGERGIKHRGVRTVEEAGVSQIWMGEVGRRAAGSLDFGNSPFEISDVDFGGKTIIQRTSDGTHGIVTARNRGERLCAASLVTAEATARPLLLDSTDQVRSWRWAKTD
jgi:2-phosphosulpholactate phosphatase